MLKKFKHWLLIHIRGVSIKGEKLRPQQIYKTTMPVPISYEEWQKGEWSRVINNTNHEKEI